MGRRKGKGGQLYLLLGDCGLREDGIDIDDHERDQLLVELLQLHVPPRGDVTAYRHTGMVSGDIRIRGS